jgi:hypothetical protein
VFLKLTIYAKGILKSQGKALIACKACLLTIIFEASDWVNVTCSPEWINPENASCNELSSGCCFWHLCRGGGCVADWLSLRDDDAVLNRVQV